MNKEILQKIGLSREESLVYMNCLESGGLLIAEVSRVAEIKRTKVYSVVESLKNKGLISISKFKKRNLITALPFESLESYLIKKSENLEKEKKFLQKIEPKLKKIKIKKKEVFSLFEGVEGIEKIVNEIIATENDIFWIGDFSILFEFMPEDKLYKLLTWRRMDKQNTSHAFTSEKFQTFKKFSEDIPGFRTNKVLTDLPETNSLIVQYGDNTAVAFTKENKLFINVIRNKEVSLLIKYLFKKI